MSMIMLGLFLLAIAGGCAILYFGYKMYRQGQLDDEATKRQRVAREAEFVEDIEKSSPKVKLTSDIEKIREFLRKHKP